MKKRLYELDWLRLIAIVILLFFHTGMFFNTWDWHIKNNDTTFLLNIPMAWLHEWRMPMLLVISGAGTYFALGFRSAKAYAFERFKRLLIPLVFGMLFIVPPQIYLERIHDYSSYFEFWPTIFQFVPYPKGSFSWHHLWFIAYLLVYSLCLLPLFLYLRSDRSKVFKAFVARHLNGGLGFGWLLLIMLATQFALRPFFPDQSHNFMDLGYVVHYGLFFLFGFLIYAIPELRQGLYHRRRLHLMIAGLSLPLFYMAWFIPYKLSFGRYDFIFYIPATTTAWYFILACLGIGQGILSRESKTLKYLNEGLYPFYILHQTVIMLVAFPLGSLEWNLWLKFLIVNILTLLICISIYLLLIRPFNTMRLCFGMKPKPPREQTVNKQEGFRLNNETAAI